MDVCDKDSITHAAQVIEEKEGKLDVLVNKYGFITSQDYVELMDR
jgi:NADP-dependent 3-hydroxy acid dehydrogenase YdfG